VKNEFGMEREEQSLAERLGNLIEELLRQVRVSGRNLRRPTVFFILGFSRGT